MHELIHHRLKPLLSHWLDAKGVSAFIVRDVAGAYTPIGDWRAKRAAGASADRLSGCRAGGDRAHVRVPSVSTIPSRRGRGSPLPRAKRRGCAGCSSSQGGRRRRDFSKFVAWARSFARGFGLVAGRRVLDVRQKHEG